MKHEKAPTAPPPRFEGGGDGGEKLMFRKTDVFGNFSQNWAIFRGRIWAKLPKGTSTRQDLSFAPTPTSIWQSATKIKPGKANVSKNRCSGIFWPKSAIFRGRIWPKLPKGTSTCQDLSYEPIHRSLRSSVTKKQPGKARVRKRLLDKLVLVKHILCYVSYIKLRVSFFYNLICKY